MFEEVRQIMIKIRDVKNAMPERVTSRPLPAETSMDNAVKPSKSRNYNTH